jgi:hypothetical protein
LGLGQATDGTAKFWTAQSSNERQAADRFNYQSIIHPIHSRLARAF